MQTIKIDGLKVDLRKFNEFCEQLERGVSVTLRSGLWLSTSLVAYEGERLVLTPRGEDLRASLPLLKLDEPDTDETSKTQAKREPQRCKCSRCNGDGVTPLLFSYVTCDRCNGSTFEPLQDVDAALAAAGTSAERAAETMRVVGGTAAEALGFNEAPPSAAPSYSSNVLSRFDVTAKGLRFGFGKHAGKLLHEAPTEYLGWMLDAKFHADIIAIVETELERRGGASSDGYYAVKLDDVNIYYTQAQLVSRCKRLNLNNGATLVPGSVVTDHVSGYTSVCATVVGSDGSSINVHHRWLKPKNGAQ